jgi:hypothetical protein
MHRGVQLAFEDWAIIGQGQAPPLTFESAGALSCCASDLQVDLDVGHVDAVEEASP